MSYTATVLKVMVASPGDVSQERQIARNIINDWNVLNAEDRRIVLLPVGWETHAWPEMGNGPQAIINKQVLQNCDILVAIFWTRLGSPTGTALSGTVEEIEEHVAAGKPSLIYFSSTPVRPDSIDNNQYSALLEFKESCRKRGLVEEYENLEEFRDKLSRHVSQTVIHKFASRTAYEGDIDLPVPKVPALTPAARELLLEAAKDSNGVLMRIDAFDGTLVETNGRQFGENRDPRSEAKWRGAVDELSSEGSVEDRTGKGEVFFVTDRGYAAADMLGAV